MFIFSVCFLLLFVQKVLPRPTGARAKSLQLCPSLHDPMDHGQVPLSRGLPRQENWSGLPRLQGISLTQGWNPSLSCLLQWQAGSLQIASPELVGYLG